VKYTLWAYEKPQFLFAVYCKKVSEKHNMAITQ